MPIARSPARQSLELSRKHQIKSVVIADRGDTRAVHGQRQGRQSRSVECESAHKLRGDMLCVCRAPPIPKQKYLVTFRKVSIRLSLTRAMSRSRRRCQAKAASRQSIPQSSGLLGLRNRRCLSLRTRPYHIPGRGPFRTGDRKVAEVANRRPACRCR